MSTPNRRRWFSFSLRTLLILMTLLSVGCWRLIHHRRVKIAERDHLLERFQRSSICLTFGDEIAGFALPDEPFLQGPCPLGQSELPPDRWEWLRPLAAPYVRAAVVYSDPDPALPNNYESVVRCAADVRFVVSTLKAPPHQEAALCDCLSTRTESLYLELEPHFELDRILAKVPNLRRLHIYNQVTRQVISALLSRPGLNDLTMMSGTYDDLAALENVSSCDTTSLEVISFDERKQQVAEDKAYRWLPGCSRLTQLKVNGSERDREFLRQVGKQLSGVETLKLSSDSSRLIDVVDIDSLRDWTRLRHLHLEGVLITDELLMAIAEQFPALQSLEIEADTRSELPTLSPAAIATLKRLPALIRLSLNDCFLQEDHLKELAALKQLRQLSLRDNRDIDDDDVKALEVLPNLELLDVEGSQVTPDTFAPLRRRWEPQPEYVNYRPVVG